MTDQKRNSKYYNKIKIQPARQKKLVLEHIGTMFLDTKILFQALGNFPNQAKEVIDMNKSKIFCTSFEVAEEFERSHAQVLRDIRRADCSDSDFPMLDLGKNCHKSTFVRNLTNVMTQEGYTFLTISYTGRKAAPVKEEIIYSGKIN